MDSIVVLTECDIFTPGLGNTKFGPGDKVESWDPNYYPLLWAGLAAPPLPESTPSTEDISARLKADREQAKES